MPHFITEYSKNLHDEINFQEFFTKVHAYLADTGIFPLGGIRSRAIRMDDFLIADGEHDYAFIHITFKIGSGREPAILKDAADGLFDLLKSYFAPLHKQRLLALSFTMQEFHPVLNYHHNNIHAFLKKNS